MTELKGELLSIRDAAAFVAMIDQELDRVAREHVELARKGRLSDQEAGYVVGVLRDIRADLIHAFSPIDVGSSIERQDPQVRWRDKVRWISRELDHRENDYPDLIRKGRMTDNEARLAVRLMRTLRRLYWRELFMWEPDAGPALDFLQAIRKRKGASSEEIDAAVPHGRETYRELVRKHVAVVELEDQPQRSLVE